jgi:hypothetical protein
MKGALSPRRSRQRDFSARPTTPAVGALVKPARRNGGRSSRSWGSRHSEPRVRLRSVDFTIPLEFLLVSTSASGPRRETFASASDCRHESHNLIGISLVAVSVQSALIPSSLIIGHHFAASAFTSASSTSAVCRSRGKTICPISASRDCATGSASASTAAAVKLGGGACTLWALTSPQQFQAEP